MKGGYIIIPRYMEDNWVFQNDRHARMWVMLKFLEEFEDGSVRIGKSRTKVEYKKGQKVVQLNELGHYLKISFRALKNFLDALVDEKLIEVDYQPKYTIITFIDCNQIGNQNSRKPKRNQQSSQSSSQPLYIEEEREEIKKENINNIPSLSREDELRILTEIGVEDYLQSRATLYNLSLDIVKIHYSKFYQRFENGIKTHKNETDLRNHFDNILTQVAERGTKKINLTNGTEQSGQSGQAQAKDKYAARRGTDAVSHSPDDYTGSF